MNTTFDMLITRLYRIRYKMQFAALSEIGLSVGQPKILSYLDGHDGCIQRDIAGACSIEPASVSVILKKMEQEGLIVRETSEFNKRICHVNLTPLGRSKVDDLKTLSDDFSETALMGFTQSQTERFIKDLQRMINNLERAENKQGHR